MQSLPKVKIHVNLEKNLINKIDLQKKYDKMSPLLRSFVRSYFLGASQFEIQTTMCLTPKEYSDLKKQMISNLKGD
jgi:hypothetical protein